MKQTRFRSMNEHSLTSLSMVLKKSFLDRFPEWQPYFEMVESENDCDKQSLYFRVPGPMDPRRFISIRERGDCIEVSLSDGRPPGGAERLLICEPGEEDQCVAAALQFVEQLTEEEIVIARKVSSWFLGRRVLPPSFIDAKEIPTMKGLVSIVSWRGTFDIEVHRNNSGI